MRIIRGKYSGLRFPEYKGSNTRPTTDLVKESLFNTLESHFDFEGSTVIDLFAGTGNIGVECLSRGASRLISVDHMPDNIRYMGGIKSKTGAGNWEILRMDALEFVRKNTVPAGFVFADPPYNYPNMHDLVNLILHADWFRHPDALFVLEHPDRLVFQQKQVILKKQYGNTSFTCFKPE